MSATVAGGFFGSFAEANSLASGGVFSFVVQALFTFSTTFLGQSTNVSFSSRLFHAGMLLGIFLGLLSLMFAVSWVCEWAYRKLVLTRTKEKSSPNDDTPTDVDRKDSTFNFNFEGGDKLP